MNMPHLKGLEVIGHMQTERRLSRIPVMMMTAERDLGLCADIFAAGATLFLQKPFTPAQMITMIHLLMAKKAPISEIGKLRPVRALARMA